VQESIPQFEVRFGDAAPVTVSAATIWLGRDPGGRIKVSNSHSSGELAQIDLRDGGLYVRDLNVEVVELNGRPLETDSPEALTSGDVIRIDHDEIEVVRDGSTPVLMIRMGAVGQGDNASRSTLPTAGQVGPGESAGSADALREFWEKRSRDKIARPSPLQPQEPPRPGKARFGWSPTADLKRPWPLALLGWAVIVFTVLAVTAALLYARAFSPGEVSDPHTRQNLAHSDVASAIAARPNGNSCTSCHALTAKMDTQCATCHRTAAFDAAATGIDAHARAGVGCVSCHSEHWGAGFAAVNAALASCATCHNDNNHESFRGVRLRTPHGGTVGYPVVNGAWKWTGLTEAEWKAKPDGASAGLQGAAMRQAVESDDDWRRRQFHALHLNRVRLGNSGLTGDAAGMLSCSSCHVSLNPADTVTPATTCAKCHNGDNGAISNQGQPVLAPTAPNCVSCHVQHAKQPGHWNAKLFSPKP
jgi:hypothetical protein